MGLKRKRGSKRQSKPKSISIALKEEKSHEFDFSF